MKLMLQEIQVWYIIPAIRAEMVQIMLSKSLKQKEIAKTLGLTEAAVSQYKKNKRANEIKLDSESKFEIRGSVENILKNESCPTKEIQRILHLIESKGTCCEIHKNYNEVCAKCERFT